MKPEHKQAIFRDICKIEDKIKGHEVNQYRTTQYVRMKIEYLNELQRHEEAQSVMDSFMYLSDIRKIKIETLRDSGKYDEALELLT